MSRRKTENFVICRPIEQLFSNKDAIRIRPLRCNYRKFVSRLYIILSEGLEVFNKMNSGLCRLDIRSHCVWTPVFLIRMLNAPDIVNTCLFAPAPPHRKNNSNEFYALSVNLHAPWIQNEMFTRQNAVRFITEQFENMLLYVACRHGCYFIARFRLDLCKLRRCIDETPFELVGKIDFTVASHFFFGKLSGA